jgi:hypothetical protein
MPRDEIRRDEMLRNVACYVLFLIIGLIVGSATQRWSDKREVEHSRITAVKAVVQAYWKGADSCRQQKSY